MIKIEQKRNPVQITTLTIFFFIDSKLNHDYYNIFVIYQFISFIANYEKINIFSSFSVFHLDLSSSLDVKSCGFSLLHQICRLNLSLLGKTI